MPEQMPEQVIACIRTRLAEGESCRTIARAIGISKTTVAKVGRRLRAGGPVYSDHTVARKPRSLNTEQEEWVLNVLAHEPTLFAKELTRMVFDEFSIQVHRTTILRMLQRRGWMRTTCGRVASERNDLSVRDVDSTGQTRT
ncbi:Hypothetical protein R9X50_00150500 [Acrodontium crateriforme]|uniref:Transposase n=1 Tax=Acrodontium crateriforme TaxID=150365 RepID=A0AAQ3M5A1_9PEZI|nr:Hypothetical protein R9X50_00150500 [Acrodontium crateriforme]